MVSDPGQQRSVDRTLEILRQRGVKAPRGTLLHRASPTLRGPTQAAGAPDLDELLPGDANADARQQVKQTLMIFDRNVGQANIPDEDFAAAFMGQESLDGPSLDAGSRILLAGLGDNLDEQNAVLRMIHPAGEIRDAGDTGILVFRKDPSEKWRKVEPGFLEAIGKEVMLRETAIDVGELTADTFVNVAAELALTRGGSGGVGSTLFRLFLANVGAEFGEEGAQRLFGTSSEGFGEVLGRGTTEGALAGGGSLAFLGVARGVRRLRGRAGESVGGAAVGAEEAIEAAERLGVDPPPLTRLSDQPLVQTFGRLSQRFAPQISRYERNVREQVLASARGLVDQAEADRVVTTATRQLETANRQVRDFVEQGVRFQPRDPTKAAEALEEAVERWWNASRRSEDSLYRLARAADDPDFDLTEPIASAQSALTRKVTPGRPRPRVDPQTGRPLLDDAGNQIFEVPSIRVGITPDSRFAELLRKMQRIDPDLPDPDVPDGVQALSRTDRIRELQKEFSDFSDWGNPNPPEQAKIARRIWGELDDVLDNPVGGDADFTRRWRRARGFARKRRETRESMAVSEIVFKNRHRGTPSQTVDDLLQSGRLATLDNLRVIRRVTTPSEWEGLRSQMKERMLERLSQPDELDRALDTMHPAIRKAFFTPREMTVFREGAEKWRQLERTGIPRAAARNTERRAFVRDLMNRRNTSGIEALHQFVEKEGGLRSEIGNQLRFAIADEIIERSVTMGRNGERIVDAKALDTALGEFQDAGLLRFLAGRDVQHLRDVEAVSALLRPSAGEAGVSIAGTSAVSNLIDGSLSAVANLAQMVGISRVLLSPGVSKFLISRGARESSAPPARRAMVIGAVATTLASGLARGSGSESDDAFDKARRLAEFAEEGKTP